MRNLRNVHRSLIVSPPGSRLTACAWDVGTDDVLCTFGPTGDDATIHLKRWKDSKVAFALDGDCPSSFVSVASWNAPCPLPDLQCDEVLSLHYFPDISTACLVFAGGDLVVVREEPNPGEDKIEIVGSVDVGISAASWSPDDELLAMTTRADTLLYMTREFENIADAQFSTDDLKISKHVNVGWGKAETQFKGKGAKALRDPTMPEKVDEGILSVNDRRDTMVSWRGDGAYVAINSIVSDLCRAIRVFSREGNLASVSEPVDGLTGALCWKPSGDLLASVQRLANRIDIVFFERNGLRHGEFPLRLSQGEISQIGANISLAWNLDSSVLAVCFSDRVQLWTMGNYHYYLKQEIIQIGSSLFTSCPLVWHSEKALRFVMSISGGLQKLEYQSTVAIGPTTPPDDFGLVSVIDGKSLKLTPMRLANVPPPMALYELELCSNALDVTITTTNNVTLLGILHQKKVTLYEIALGERTLQVPERKWVADIPSTFDSLSPPSSRFVFNHHISFDQDGRIVILQSSVDGSRSLVLKTDSKIQQELEWSLDEPSQPISGSTEMRVNDGIIRNGGQACEPRTTFLLSSNGRLLADRRQLAQNCTSFLVTPTHLIFTTSQHLLKFVHMTDVENLRVPPDTPEVDERCRIIERGAKLITVMPSKFALVMQMPRGNLETIYPRALVLAGIRECIDAKKYRKAFLACRDQRVDMNILHDHLPEQFLADVALFIDQIKKVEYIDLFLSQLRNEDVSRTMYQETLRADQQLSVSDNTPVISKTVDENPNKVNMICDAFLDDLRKRTSTNLQNVITAHVCKAPPDLDAGLTEIARLREQDQDQAEAAIEHICFLADPNRLYDNALGLYDLELALLVAQQTQKDPREYLPFLQNLEEMPALRRQYFIDNYLGRYSKALQHLYDLKVIEEVKAYTVKHSLYTQAMELYRYQPELSPQILRLNADHLQAQRKYQEAGIAYEHLQEYNLASESYCLAHLWKESLFCANLAGLDEYQIRSLAHTLADDRVETKDFGSAAVIHLDYLSDVKLAARFYCKGYFFAEAMRLVTLHHRADLLASEIDTGLVEGMAAMTELLADCKSQLNAQVPRICELREKKANDPLAFFEGEVAGANVPDNVSLAPTDASIVGVSLFTRYTNQTGTMGTGVSRQTSKNKRREERKRARGKKGSVYEESYLVNSVGRLVERVNSVGDEVERLVTGLLRRSMWERAVAVENAIVEAIKLCKDYIAKIYPTTTPKQDGIQEMAIEVKQPTGRDGVFFDSMESEQAREAPVVKEFRRLALSSG